MLYYRIIHVIEASSFKHIKQLKNMDITLVITIAKSPFISFGCTYAGFGWPSEACKRRFQACRMDDLGLLNGPYNDALMVSPE